MCPDICASDDECMTTCADFPVSGMYSTLEHNTDTVDCRQVTG